MDKVDQPFVGAKRQLAGKLAGHRFDTDTAFALIFRDFGCFLHDHISREHATVNSESNANKIKRGINPMLHAPRVQPMLGA